MAVVAADLTPGAVFEEWWPFLHHDDYRRDNSGAPLTDGFWSPGWTAEGGEYETLFGWEGEGAQVRTIVSVHKPGESFAPRVFYKRQWRNPEGAITRRARLCVETVGVFLKFANGGKLHFLAESRGENNLLATIWPTTLEEEAA